MGRVVGGESAGGMLTAEAKALIVSLVEYPWCPRARLIEVLRLTRVIRLPTSCGVVSMRFEVLR
jgi:hypothetical protein